MSTEERYSSDKFRLEELTSTAFMNGPDPFLNEVASQELFRRQNLHHELRSYEVSLWTLQDEFITVLKWSDNRQLAGIQDARMTLNVDGTQNFSFTIPMYLYEMNEGNRRSTNLADQPSMDLIENPIWYNTRNGNLITGIRKIKVIFNKGDTEKEGIYEFIIIKINEEHESDQLTCKVECEGLAFHEIGKIGYKYKLSNDEFLVDDDDWRKTGIWHKKDGTAVTTQPLQTVQYWCELCRLEPLPVLSRNPLRLDYTSIDPTKWYYDIRMEWDSFESSGAAPRSNQKVYEDAYPMSWRVTNNKLYPTAMAKYKEKERPVEASDSNIYNITQTIAETFEIYCKYEYAYDENYHIIARTIVFFNNYMHEKDHVFTFTYPHSSKSISREMDSSQLTTKMFVTPIDDSSTLEGQINIMTCDANRSKEDYLLNFEYMKEIGAITEEQYKQIESYEANMRTYNDQLTLLALELEYYNTSITEKEAKQTVLNESIALDTQQIKYTSDLAQKLTNDHGDGDGYIIRDKSNPYSTYVHVDADGKSYIRMNDQDKGIKADTIQVYKTYNSATNELENLIEAYNYRKETDEYGDINQLIFNSSYTDESKLVYLIYKYKPSLYYDAVLETWQLKKKNDEDALDAVNADIATLEASRDAAEAEQTRIINLKNTEVYAFERMMGPALREGYWQPSDYADYGESKVFTANSFPIIYQEGTMLRDTGTDMLAGWDPELLETEEKFYYTSGINETKCYYPCIDLSNHLAYLTGKQTASTKLSFVFNNNYYKELEAGEENNIKNLTNFTIGADAILGFMAVGAVVRPILILIGAKSMTDAQINFMLSTDPTKGHPRLGFLKTTVDNGVPTTTLTDMQPLTSAEMYWEPSRANTATVTDITDATQITQVMPRIKCSSSRLKTDISNLVVSYNNALIEKFEDYSVITRVTNRIDNDNVKRAYPEYFITLKPEMLINTGTYTAKVEVQYRLSNATTSIYLDAKEVLAESAYPKVAYSLSPQILNIDFMQEAYKSLYQLVMINDVQLKLKDTFGYISQVDLNLDKPWEDTIEVKNYKTKFEDLFSSIIASTEQMEKNSSSIRAAIAGKIGLTVTGVQNTMAMSGDTISAYFDSHFDTSEVVRDKLTEIFTEAGKILSAASSSLGDIHALNLNNATILGGFIENITAQLTPTVVNSQTQPEDYKVGDVWNQLDENGNIIGKYVATASSTDHVNGYTRTFDGSLASIVGASLTVDAVAGTVSILAQNSLEMKSGGNLYIAANENVEIVGNKSVNIGGTRINLASCGAIKEQSGISLIASSDDDEPEDALILACINNLIEPYKDQYTKNNQGEDVLIPIYENPKFQAAINGYLKRDITRQQYYLNFSEKESNRFWFEQNAAIGSVDSPNYQAIFTILKRKLNNDKISKVTVFPYRVDMTSANIYMKGSSKILAVASTTDYATGISAVKIDADDGVWIGSNNGIRLYGGAAFEYNDETKTLQETSATQQNGGASVELNSTHLLLGFSNIVEDDNGEVASSAIEMTDKQIIIAKGTILSKRASENVSLRVTGTAQGLIGAKFTDTSIGLAVQNEEDISALLMDKNGLTLGAGTVDLTQVTIDPAQNGSFVRIASDGIQIGALGNLYLNTNNIKLQSDSYYHTRFAIGNNLQNINTDIISRIEQTISAENVSEENSYIVNLVQNDNGLFVRGIVYADAFKAIGSVGAVGQETGTFYFLADSTHMGFYDDSNQGLLTFTNTGSITSYANLTLTAGTDIRIDTENFFLDSSQENSNNILELRQRVYSGNSSNYTNKKFLEYSVDNGLILKGQMTATSFKAIDDESNSIQNHFIVDASHLGFYSVNTAQQSNNTTALLTIDNEGKIKANSDLVLESDKNLTVNTDNIVIDSTGTEIFKLRTYVLENNEKKYTNQLVFDTSTGLTVTGTVNAETGIIGGWTIDEGSIWRTSGNRAYLHHNVDNKDWAIYVGGSGQFRVDYDGNVWLQALWVDGQLVDFTTTFKNAVRLWGEWDGGTLQVYARFYENSALTASSSLTATADVSLIACGAGSFSGSYNCTATLISKFTIEGAGTAEYELSQKEATATYAYFDGWQSARAKIYPKKDVPGTRTYIAIPGSDPEAADEQIDLTPVYNQGWNDCLAACTKRENAIYGYTSTSSTLYTGTAGTLSVTGVGDVSAISPYDTWSSGGGFKGGTKKDLYEIPDAK